MGKTLRGKNSAWQNAGCGRGKPRGKIHGKTFGKTDGMGVVWPLRWRDAGKKIQMAWQKKTQMVWQKIQMTWQKKMADQQRWQKSQVTWQKKLRWRGKIIMKWKPSQKRNA